MTHWIEITDHISQTTGEPFQLTTEKSLGGGSINSAYKLTADNGLSYFVKLNSAHQLAMFQTEYTDLLELQKAQLMHIPRPICFGTQGTQSYLVTEYISLHGRGDTEKLGRALAQMHRITTHQFGWKQNNTIGSTPQSNRGHDNWLDFWRDERLIPQFEMLYEKGYRQVIESDAGKLFKRLDSLLSAHKPEASLLHGDLWSGNYAFDNQGKAVIFDPALYYGDRETDLAMTELFGGFSQTFYAAYNEAYPLDDGYQSRKTLYNLYHILNHTNLFGSGYLNQAIRMMQALLI
jgi:fructosamine-3-kinase